MNRPSLLEAQFELHSQHPDYGTAQPGVRFYDLDTDHYIEPEEAGLYGDPDEVQEFMIAQGADPQHVQFTTIGLYGKNSRLAESPSGATRRGFISKDLAILGDEGLRFPVISLLNDPSIISEKRLNTVLRHEAGHLLRPDRTALYNNRRAGIAIKSLSQLTTALVAPPAFEMWDYTHTMPQLPEGTTASTYATSLLGLSALTLASASLAISMTANSRRALEYLAIEENRVDFFAWRHRNFKPFSYKP